MRCAVLGLSGMSGVALAIAACAGQPPPADATHVESMVIAPTVAAPVADSGAAQPEAAVAAQEPDEPEQPAQFGIIGLIEHDGGALFGPMGEAFGAGGLGLSGIGV